MRARLVLENDEVSCLRSVARVFQLLDEPRCVTMPKIFSEYVKNWMSPSFSVSKRGQNGNLATSLNTPLDYHHDILNPSSISPSEIIKRADAIWKRRGIRPKQHLSEPRPGAVTLMERRAHADRCEALPIELPDDMGESMLLLPIQIPAV